MLSTAMNTSNTKYLLKELVVRQMSPSLMMQPCLVSLSVLVTEVVIRLCNDTSQRYDGENLSECKIYIHGYG